MSASLLIFAGLVPAELNCLKVWLDSIFSKASCKVSHGADVSECSIHRRRDLGGDSHHFVEDGKLTDQLKLQFASQTRRNRYFGRSRLLFHIVFGLGLYILDIVTDILVVLEYYKLEREYQEDRRNDEKLDDTKPPKYWLFYSFLFFLVVPIIVYNVISLCLYLIGDLRLRYYIKSWLVLHLKSKPSSLENVKIRLSSSKWKKYVYYPTMVLAHILLLAPIFRLVELIVITFCQVRIRSQTKFQCSRCRKTYAIKSLCSKHDSTVNHSNSGSKEGSTRSLNNNGRRRKALRMTKGEVRLKLAYADALQSWADCKFLQSVSSNLESLPQLAIEIYAFYNEQLIEGQEWINYVSFSWSVLTFCYSIASFRHMPYDYEAVGHRREDQTDEVDSAHSPSSSTHSSRNTSRQNSHQDPASFENAKVIVFAQSKSQEKHQDQVDFSINDHCVDCCFSKSKVGEKNESICKKIAKFPGFIASNVVRRMPKFYFTVCMGLIIAPRVLALVIMNTLSFIVFLYASVTHLFLVVICNMFMQIRVCYNVLEYKPATEIEDYTLGPLTGNPIDDRNQTAPDRRLSDIEEILNVTTASGADVPLAFEDWSTAPVTDESKLPNSPADEHDGADLSAHSIVRRLSTDVESIVSRQDLIEAVRMVKMMFRLPTMSDEIDGTYGPITFVGTAKMEQISWASNKFLWLFAGIVQFTFDILIAIPFLFYFVHVQELKRKRWFTAVYYHIWFLENIVIVALNIVTHEVTLLNLLHWPSRLLGMTCTVLFMPLVGFALLRIYHVKFDPEKRAKSDVTDKTDLQTELNQENV